MTQSLQIANPETTTPPPAPRGAEWVTLAEAARRSGWGERHLRRLCVDRWEPMGLARRVPAERGGKASWEVRDDAHAKLARVKFAGQIAADLSDLTDAQRAEVGRRFRVLAAWERAVPAHLNAGRSKDEATAAFLAAFPPELGEAPAASTLYRWERDYRAEGRRGLVDRRWFNAPKSDPAFGPFLEEVRRLYLDLRQPKLRRCCEIARGKAIKMGWAVPSYATADRFIKSLDEGVKVRRRKGSKAYDDRVGGYIERDPSTLASNEVWFSDHHRFDVMVRVPGAEKPVRPWVTAWMDWRSRKVVGYRVFAHDPNSDTILQAFGEAALSHGLPERVYLDGGKDYDAEALQGQTKRERRGGRPLDQDAAGVFPDLGIKVMHALPYNARAKGPLERWFGTMEDQLCRTQVDTYCGNAPANRPENLAERIERGQAPTLEEFAALFARYVDADYHAAPHTGFGMGGKSPNQVFEEALVSKRTADAETLAHMLRRPSRLLKVGRNGVRCNGLTYDGPALDALFGKPVRLRVDPANVNSATAYDAEGRFVGVVQVQHRLPANATAQEVRDFHAARKRRERRRRQAAADAPRMAEDVGLHIARTRAEDAAAARVGEGPTEPTPPPSIRPVMGTLATQAAAAARAAVGTVTRRAVGAEYLEALERAEASAAEELSPAPAAHPALARLYDRPEEP